jgi:hypothetical protein
MARTHLFECSRCDYRAEVAGREEFGLHVGVRTIHCLDCKALYDVVIALKVVAVPASATAPSLPRAGSRKPVRPPAFETALNRMLPGGSKRFTWLKYELLCPVAPEHRVAEWRSPGRCPRCGVYLEANAIPFRLWE